LAGTLGHGRVAVDVRVMPDDPVLDRHAGGALFVHRERVDALDRFAPGPMVCAQTNQTVVAHQIDLHEFAGEQTLAALENLVEYPRRVGAAAAARGENLTRGALLI